MKQTFCTLILILIYVTVLAQGTIKKIRSMEVIITKGDTVIKADILTNIKNGTLHSYLMYYWYQNGEINNNQGGYSGKLLHGPYREIVNNKLICNGEFYTGLKSGKWEYWDESGNIKNIEKWHRGKLINKDTRAGKGLRIQFKRKTSHLNTQESLKKDNAGDAKK